MNEEPVRAHYRGRLAPSPTGRLHLGHARTFWIAQHRARANGGTLILRNEDLDRTRCRPEFVDEMIRDLRWFGFDWAEGPDVGGPFAPYAQSERSIHYLAAFERLRELGLIYPCTCSRNDVLRALSAPHAGDEGPIYPGTCRAMAPQRAGWTRSSVNWRFRLPDGETISFLDGRAGLQSYVTGREFGDFLIWRKDDLPSYQLAVMLDDAAMQITEVVRGADLIPSTFRQLILYRAFGIAPPAFYHCPLILDEQGERLSKRNKAATLSALRAAGRTPEELRATWARH